MKKQELIKKVSKASGHPDQTVRSVLESVVSVTQETIQTGSPVMLFGLGKLDTSERRPKAARNIRTGETVMVPARRVVVFRPSVGLMDAAAKR